MLPELPVGMQTFEELRRRNAIYVDKTNYFPLLSRGRKVAFCARPRRFGKSLTVSALDAFHSGRKELFKGLAAEKFMNSPEFAPKPVIHLDMSEADDCESLDDLKESLMSCLEVNAARHKISLRGARPAIIFSNLLKDVRSTSTQGVVLLIDEYDTPVISLIQRQLLYDRRQVEQTRIAMRSFYSKIKSNDSSLDFVFITGVSKFSRMGVFSTLNNLEDISNDAEFAAFMGLTEEELESDFTLYVKDTAEGLKIEEAELLNRIRDYYDGFSFDGETRVYNPFSTLLFFKKRKFNKYWVESGSNGLIRKFLKDKNLVLDDFSGLEVSADFASSPGEIGSTPPEGFLYQAGYLTLRKDSRGDYSLDYPNFEVRSALSALFLDNLYASETLARDAMIEMGKYLAVGDVPNMVANIRRMYSGLTYLDHTDAVSQRQVMRILGAVAKVFGKKLKDILHLNQKENYLEATRQKLGESFYRATLQACLWGTEAYTRPEAHNNLVRIDLEVSYKDQVYIIELKTSQGASASMEAAHAGMARIRKRDYGGTHKNPILISMAVDLEIRNLGACVFVKNGETTVLDSEALNLLHKPRRRKS
ncbi:MAG: ATP-binding protein [Deltaproteobacteria bacterium]|jgi:hypothetical protein|nr:ATP-binding protein [Deltaproteobacteria bacterium]